MQIGDTATQRPRTTLGPPQRRSCHGPRLSRKQPRLEPLLDNPRSTKELTSPESPATHLMSAPFDHRPRRPLSSSFLRIDALSAAAPSFCWKDRHEYPG